MAQDYAKLRNRPTGRESKGRAATRAAPTASTHWYWYFSGVMSGFFVVFIVYVGIGNFSNPAPEVADPAAVQIQREEPDFTFFRELANATVDVGIPEQPIPEAPGTDASPTTIANAATTVAVDQREYLLQAGSFQDRADAENRRAKIILLNMNASIVPGVVAGRTWMRVQVGPFSGRQSAESARAILSENNIDSIPLLAR